MSAPQPESQQTDRSGCLHLVVFTIVAAWIVGIVVTRAAALPSFYIYPGPETPWLAATLAAGTWFLLSLPLLPLAIWMRERRYAAIYRTWALATALNLVFLPVYFVNPSDAQLQAALHILLGLVACAVLWLVKRRFARSEPAITYRSRNGRRKAPLVLIALALGACLAYPWLAWGAFGSLVDILAAGAMALVFGLLGSILLEGFLFPGTLTPGQTDSPAETASKDWRRFLLVAISAGITLLILSAATAFSFGEMQILLMVVLPPLGGTLAGLHQMAWSRSPDDMPAGDLRAPSPTSNHFPMVVLVALAAAAPLTLVDPDELSLLVASGPGEILAWARRAANLSAITGLSASMLAFLIVLAGRKLKRKAPYSQKIPAGWNAVLALLLLVAWTAGGIIYTQAGQPGFYGERLFVILKDQADVSAAPGIQDYNARRQYVYETLTSHALRTQAELRQELDRMGIAYTPYYLLNGLEVQADFPLRAWLSGRTEVDRILDSPRMRPLPEPPPPETGGPRSAFDVNWNLAAIHAPEVWKDTGITGKGIVIGQSDTGAQADHAELFDSYRGQDGDQNYNWFDPWFGSTAPYDINGHGTHILGIILGNTTGVAPDATWYGCVNLGRNLGNPALYLDCMQFMLAPFPLGGDPFTDGDASRGAHISNNSWGCPEMEGCDPRAFLPAVAALRAAGIFVVAAAGNTGPDCSSIEDPPAIYDSVFSVGAITRSGSLTGFSSLGPVEADGSGRVKPDLLAPGAGVLSAQPGNTYAEHSGTSMAAPHVAGVVALMWSANPNLIGDIDRTEQILDESAAKYVGNLPDCPGAADHPSTAVGFGVVDAYAAVQMALDERR